ESIDETPPSDAIAPDLPITDSLVMKDEHLDTIPETDSDEEIETSVKNLYLTLSESEDLSDYVSECDLPFCDNSPDFNNDFEIFSNPLFDSKDDYTSSDDESYSEEDVLYPVIHQPRQEMSMKMLLAKEKLIKAIRTCLKNNNQPPEEKSIAILLAEESIVTVMQTLEEKQIDTEKSIDETPPSDAIAPDLPITDSLVMKDEHLDTIPETDSDEEIETSVKNLYLTLSESEDLSDYVSEFDLPFCDNSPNFNNDFEKENSGSTTIHTYISLIEYESFYDESDSASEIFNDDLAHIISPLEYEYVYADDESDSGDLTTKVTDDISDNSTRELYVHVPNVLTTLPTLYPVFDTLLPLSSENKDKVFNPGILISKEEKSPPLLSHRGLRVF
nr:hypothetical protein [Tanacetum cinerariifolium]